ncbi:MAG: hypothetical protein N4A63_07600 [Vallitalea sp.]|jgi:hypothetical protein|nr:hypothetical protein [Vallitalea sp.]
MKNDHLGFKALFNELYGKSKNPLFKFSSFECYFSIIISMIISSLGYFIYQVNGIQNFTSIIKNVILGFGFSLIGLLGFIITGLSIMISTFDNKSIDTIRKSGRLIRLKSILFSFYFIGLVIGVEVLFSFILFFIVSIDISFNMTFYWISCLLYTYVASFVLLYSVSLLGTCFHMFFIKFGYQESSKNTLQQEINFLHLKVDALSKILYGNDIYEYDQFIECLEQIINDEYPECKEELFKRINEYYNLKIG